MRHSEKSRIIVNMELLINDCVTDSKLDYLLKKKSFMTTLNITPQLKVKRLPSANRSTGQFFF